MFDLDAVCEQRAGEVFARRGLKAETFGAERFVGQNGNGGHDVLLNGNWVRSTERIFAARRENGVVDGLARQSRAD